MKAKPNRLLGEKSPYLRQHAYNPVDWHPWGEEAFARAERENKPIFLSIGYSTCHWCHVMERESFSSPELAEVMNRLYVSIKVDREERPDVDEIYMGAANGAGWGGGWPLSMWLTPELKPFFGGTYFPPSSSYGRPGFRQVLERVAEVWKAREADVRADSERLTEALRRHAKLEGRAGPLEAAALEQGALAFEADFDDHKGGFSGAPKFPMPANLSFLMRRFAASGGQRPYEMVRKTLQEMARGGVYDQLGGGFHRYSTDGAWRVPHFEKMLYDNAQLVVSYLEAWQARREPGCDRVARETLDYLLRDLASSEGAFYSAEDADSLPPELAGKVDDSGHEHRAEGAFYVWTRQEVLDALGASGEPACRRWGVLAEGNAPLDPHGEFHGKNILYAADEGEAEPAGAKALLLERRAKRPRPHRDEKVLTDWNGLALTAFAKAAQILGEERYAEAARRCAEFLRERLWDAKARRLYRVWAGGERRVPGLASDYVFLTQGLLDLYEARFEPRWLQWALELAELQLELFYDREAGGLFQTASGHDSRLLVRTLDGQDNVIPAPSSTGALNFLRLAQCYGREDLREAAEKTLKRFGRQMLELPRSLPQMLVALDWALAKPLQIVIAGERDAADTRALLREVHGRFLPARALLLADAEGREALGKGFPGLESMRPMQGRAAAYVCVDFACERPVASPEELGALLDRSVR